MNYGNVKRFLALLGAILLFSMYVVTLIAAITASPSSNGFFMASLFCTVAVPALLYAMNLAYRVLSRRGRQNQPDSANSETPDSDSVDSDSGTVDSDSGTADSDSGTADSDSGTADSDLANHTAAAGSTDEADNTDGECR